MKLASTQALTFRYVLVLLLIAVLALVAYLTLDQVIEKGRLLMHFVRISDEQQMCAQRMAYFSLRLSQPGSASEHDVCRTRLKEETGQLLQDEDAEVKKGGPLDQVSAIAPELVPLYFGEPSHLDKEVRDYVTLASKVAAVPDGDITFDDPDVATIQEKNYNELLDGLNKGVAMLRMNWENERSLAISVQLTIFLITLATLVVAGLFIFRPMVNLIVAENQQLMASERRLMAVFDTVGEAIFSAGEEGKILSANSEAARLWEYEIKDLIGQSVDYLFSEAGFFHEACEESAAADPTLMVTYVEAEAISRHGRRFRRKWRLIGPRSMERRSIRWRPATSPNAASTRNACWRPRKWRKQAIAPNPSSWPI